MLLQLFLKYYIVIKDKKIIGFYLYFLYENDQIVTLLCPLC
jgi:hypothetical protein